MTTLNDAACVEILERARARFETRVGPATDRGCLEWQGAKDAYGYGKFCALPLGTELKAHRVAWVLANGPIPADRPVIRHVVCDHPPCVNPLHLTPGTQTENVADAVEKGRNSAGRGEGHRKAKLTEAIVAEIRAPENAATSCAELGRRYGVGRDQISRIRTGKVWRSSSRQD